MVQLSLCLLDIVRLFHSSILDPTLPCPRFLHIQFQPLCAGVRDAVLAGNRPICLRATDPYACGQQTHMLPGLIVDLTIKSDLAIPLSPGQFGLGGFQLWHTQSSGAYLPIADTSDQQGSTPGGNAVWHEPVSALSTLQVGIRH